MTLVVSPATAIPGRVSANRTLVPRPSSGLELPFRFTSTGATVPSAALVAPFMVNQYLQIRPEGSVTPSLLASFFRVTVKHLLTLAAGTTPAFTSPTSVVRLPAVTRLDEVRRFTPAATRGRFLFFNKFLT